MIKKGDRRINGRHHTRSRGNEGRKKKIIRTRRKVSDGLNLLQH